MHNLIICPVGNPLTFDSRFNKEKHWRYTNNHRTYETLVAQYKDFDLEENTYDFLVKQTGQKWQLVKNILSSIDYKKYEYIGFFDDDLITSCDDINQSIILAKERNLKLFQLSVTHDSDVFYPILRKNDSLVYSLTNFIEIMGPFIHTSLIPICMDLWNRYDIVSGWGFDKVLCDLTKTNAAVIHKYSMYHPQKNSSYDKKNAFEEMNMLLFDLFPKFMKEKYNENWNFVDEQKNVEFVLK